MDRKLYFQPLVFKAIGPDGGWFVRLMATSPGVFMVQDTAHNEDEEWSNRAFFSTWDEAKAEVGQRIMRLADVIAESMTPVTH